MSKKLNSIKMTWKVVFEVCKRNFTYMILETIITNSPSPCISKLWPAFFARQISQFIKLNQNSRSVNKNFNMSRNIESKKRRPQIVYARTRVICHKNFT